MPTHLSVRIELKAQVLFVLVGLGPVSGCSVVLGCSTSMETICFHPWVKNIEHKSANFSFYANSNLLSTFVSEYTIHLARFIIGVQPQLSFFHTYGCSRASEVLDTSLSNEGSVCCALPRGEFSCSI